MQLQSSSHAVETLNITGNMTQTVGNSGAKDLLSKFITLAPIQKGKSSRSHIVAQNALARQNIRFYYTILENSDKMSSGSGEKFRAKLGASSANSCRYAILVGISAGQVRSCYGASHDVAG